MLRNTILPPLVPVAYQSDYDKSQDTLSSDGANFNLSNVENRHDENSHELLKYVPKSERCAAEKEIATGWIEHSELPTSHIFLKDSNNHIYLLRFQTANAVIHAEYLVEKSLTDSDVEKTTQTYTKENYAMKWFPNHSRMMLYVRRDKARTKCRKLPAQKTLSKTSTKSAPQDISETIVPVFSSIIYIDAFNMKMVLQLPKFVKIDAVRSNDDTTNKTMMPDFSRISTYAVYQKNLLKITVDVVDAQLDYVSPQISRAESSYSDDVVYYKIFCDISSKVLFCPLPRTTYYYRDPLINIKRENLRLSIHKKDPVWKERLRQNRLREQMKRNEREFLKRYEKKGGTSITARLPGISLRARCGISQAKIVNGKQAFRDWATDIHRMKLAESRSHHIVESCLSCDVISGKNAESFHSRGGYKIRDWYLATEQTESLED